MKDEIKKESPDFIRLGRSNTADLTHLHYDWETCGAGEGFWQELQLKLK